MIEYQVFSREENHVPRASWGCGSGDGWQSAGVILRPTTERSEAETYLAWLLGEHREEIKNLSEDEDLRESNRWHLKWECYQRTEFKLFEREISLWKVAS